MPHPFSLLIKPVSCDCNLRCDYCFYTGKTELFGHGRHLMPAPLLEQLCAEFLAIPMENHLFCWQGGEPTLAGLDFYRKAVECMKRFGGAGVNVSNALQTNGTLLTDEWGEFLAEYRFLMGVSLDGPPPIHNRFRQDTSGRGSYKEAVAGVKVLQRHAVPFNALTVVNSHSADHPLEIYRHLRDDLGIQYHQYIEETTGELAVSAHQWGDFLITIFDEWFTHDQRRVSIRLFDSIMNKLETGRADCCAMSSACNQYLVIEHDGSIFPCDFHVLPAWRLGKVGETPLPSVFTQKLSQEFAKRKQPPSECKECPYLHLCAADCPRNRMPGGKSRLCEGWKRFFRHCLGI
jgi:uncharacterized protein